MRKKEVVLSLGAAVTAMVAMLGIQEAHITKVPHTQGFDLVFQFASHQMFSLSFSGERLVASKLNLVQGREPTMQAMLAVQHQTTVNTVELFSGLKPGDVLPVEVVDDDAFSLHKSDVTMATICAINSILGAILQELFDIEVMTTDANLGDRVEALRAQLVLAVARSLAA